MGFCARMNANVGDRDFVARYLFEKVGHTAFFTLVFHALGASLWHASWGAVAFYLVLSKVWDRIDYHDWKTFWKDGAFYRRLIYIAVILSLVPAFASVDVYGRTRVVEAFGVWVLAFYVADYSTWAGYAA
jgi:hypothetical protein